MQLDVARGHPLSATTPTTVDDGLVGSSIGTPSNPQQPDQLVELSESDAAPFSLFDRFRFARWRRRVERLAKRDPDAYAQTCRSRTQQ